MRSLFNIIIFQLIFTLTQAEVKKCCKDDQYVEKYLNTNTAYYKCSNISKNCLTGNICFDQTINEDFVLLNCEEGSFKKVNLDIGHKCCPNNMLYNIKTKHCVSTLEGNQRILSENLTIGMPYCDGSVYDISLKNLRYDSEEEVFKFTDLELFDNVPINSNETCMDMTTNSEIIFRSCIHRSLCNGFSCIRKCCPHGQAYLQKTTGRSRCESAHLSFEPHIFNDEDIIGK